MERENGVCVLFKGKEPNEELGLIAAGIYYGNTTYVKTDNNS